MFRLSRVTDYGIVLLAELARDWETGPHNARELAEDVHLPAPMVSKILKTMARGGLVRSQRGSHGGYELATAPQDLTVADIIHVLEGPVALTQCTESLSLCDHQAECTISLPWLVINRAVQTALGAVTLADLIRPDFGDPHGLLHISSTPATPSA